jgi:hypothetical protein
MHVFDKYAQNFRNLQKLGKMPKYAKYVCNMHLA